MRSYMIRGSGAAGGGMTLIELMIAMVVLVIILGAVFGTILNSQSAYNQGLTEINAQDAASRVINQMKELITESKVISVNGTELVLQKPVDWDGDGDVLDNAMNVEYGAYYNGEAHLNATSRIAFGATGVTREATLGYDLNGDGDVTDEFTSGAMFVRFYDSGGAPQTQYERQISGDLICIGDVDGSGTVDPMFERWDSFGPSPTGNTIVIFFLSLKTARDRFPHVLDIAARITPRNF